MKQKNEVENLLSLIFQAGGKVTVKDGQLLVGPRAIAQRFGDQIRKLKPEILSALGHTFCPVCGRKLMVERGEFPIKIWEQIKTGRQLFCPEPRHFNKWEFEEGKEG